MTKYFFIVMAALFIGSCGGGSPTPYTPDVDSTSVKIDTLVSDVDWGDDDDKKEEKSHRHHSHSSSSSSSNNHSGGSSGGGGGAADSDADVLKYQNYSRVGESPKDFAEAAIYPAIRMVYSDNFAKPRVSVLNSNEDGGRYTIDMQITWKDHWVPKYMIKGTLEVNTDGSNATFKITDKNVDAEVLELTEDNTKSEISISSL